MAGSAALILLTLQTVASPLLGLLYIALFGVGSMLGMAILSVIIAIPLRYSAHGMTWLHNGLQIVIGFVTVGVGAMLVYQIGWQEHLIFCLPPGQVHPGQAPHDARQAAVRTRFWGAAISAGTNMGRHPPVRASRCRAGPWCP